MRNILAPSILAADFSCLGEQIAAVEAAGAEYLHLDVMDGAFVPSISFGMPVIESLREKSRLTFDLHLMVQDPERYLDEFAAVGADIITVHAEACTHLDRTLYRIRKMGLKAGVAINPATPLSALEWVVQNADMILVMSVNPGFGGQAYIPYINEKIRTLRTLLQEKGLEPDIEVDGGVTLANVSGILEAGANVIVTGSSVFRGDAAENTKRFLEIMK